jgi:hypothetical protein
MRYFLALTLVFSGAAYGQSLTVAAVSGYATAFNQAECVSTAQIQIEWTIGTDPTQGSGLTSDNTYQLWISAPGAGGSCPTSNVTETPSCISSLGATCPQSPVAGDSNVVVLSTSDVFNWSASDAGLAACPPNESLTFPVCFLLVATPTTVGVGTTTTYVGSIDISYESEPPPSPSIDHILEGDTRLVISFSTSVSNPLGFTLYWTLAPPGSASACPAPEPDAGFAGDNDPGVQTKGLQPAATTGEIDGLTDDQPYEVWMTVTDSASNVSTDSPHCYAMPHAIDDFWAAYKQQGGADSGGCGYAGSPAMLLAIAGAWLPWRRRRR